MGQLDFEKVYQDAETIVGYPNREELKTLYDLAMSVPGEGAIVEVGCDYGKSTSVLCAVAQARDLELIVVDNFSYHETPAEKVFHENLKRLGYEKEYDLYRMDSIEAAHTILQPNDENHKIDLLFLDGDHLYEAVVKDIYVWAPKVRSGGIIAFHDYENVSFPGVKEAVDELLEDWTSLGIHRTLNVMQKP